jgi:site-specific DNA-methyltransferase (adenine-specific)
VAKKYKLGGAGVSPAQVEQRQPGRSPHRYPEQPERTNPVAGIVCDKEALVPLNLVYEDTGHGIYLYQGDCLEVLDAIAAKHPDGCFDMVFADPPYFLSNGGITCHAGKMVSVHKGDWDKSNGPEENHNFNRAWLERCQRVLKPNGTLWVTGTHHVIFSVGYAMQQLGMKILNDIAWEKPNPPPNLSCRYFTHSTETVLWAAKNDKSRHVFNYKAMKAVTGKQMKTVWRKEEFTAETPRAQSHKADLGGACVSLAKDSTAATGTVAPLEPIWTLPAPGKAEKEHGKHPTQKPVGLVERCLLAATNPGDLVLDPFMGGGTTAVACARQHRHFVGIELDFRYLAIAGWRLDTGVLRVRIKIDLDLPGNLIDPINAMPDKPDIAAESIFHETKFVFLSCAQPRQGSVVHTTVDADVQSAWSHTPQSAKLVTTHIVRCETEILRVKNS